MAIEVGEDVLDEDLAAELLAEEADVAADDRTEIEQDRRFARRERLQKLAQRLRGEDRILDDPTEAAMGSGSRSADGETDRESSRKPARYARVAGAADASRLGATAGRAPRQAAARLPRRPGRRLGG